MSNLVKLPKNGSLAHNSTAQNFPSLSRLFEDLSIGELPSLFASNFNTGLSLPKVNIKEEADAFIVEMAVPGLKKSDFNLNLENNMLSISAEIEEKNEDKTDGYTRREFGYSSFKRTFSLPETVEDTKIIAKYNEGILNIHLPKKEEAKQKPARTINIS